MKSVEIAAMLDKGLVRLSVLDDEASLSMSMPPSEARGLAIRLLESAQYAQDGVQVPHEPGKGS